jgi:uncharacterized protein YdeI (YjbR/CyaY-like superfamily)
MSAKAVKSFRAVLEPTGTELRWVIACVPANVTRGWKGRRARGEINGFAFRTSLFPNSRDGGHTVLVTKKMQAGARAKPGDTVEIRLEPDMEERPEVIPDELTRALKAERGLRRWFDGLTPSFRRYVGGWVSEPKSAESRKRRAEQTAEWLLLTKEGELETPPIVRAAFQRRPGTREGWEAMTPVRRRNHLLGIFHCQGAEAREKRVRMAMEDALQLARRREAVPKSTKNE